VIAMAAWNAITVQELGAVDFAYSPPLGTANDAVNMAAFAAANRISGFSPSLAVDDLDTFMRDESPFIIDVRDSFAFAKGHIVGARHVPLEFLPEVLSEIPTGHTVLVYDDTGKKGHQALRSLKGVLQENVYNIGGGFVSLARHVRTVEVHHYKVELPILERKTLNQEAGEKNADSTPSAPQVSRGPLIVDVRTPVEFAMGAFPGAINIPLDELSDRIDELGTLNREITLYCASGARSGYGTRLLQDLGFTHVTNGGGIAHMMRRSGQ